MLFILITSFILFVAEIDAAVSFEVSSMSMPSEFLISDYGLVIDAGSTHTELFVYQFAHRVAINYAFAPETSPKQVASSGSYGAIGDLISQSDCDRLISSLLNNAKAILISRSDAWSTFNVYLKATAGMRLLPSLRREEIMGFIDNSFLNKTINPFLFNKDNAIIASGEEEATFDWLAVNYIYNTLNGNGNDESNTYGALDLGGGSTQIAFAPEPNNDILSDFTSVRLWNKTHRLYTHSFLQYGTNEIEQRIAQNVYNLHTEGMTYNPCLNNGTSKNYVVWENEMNSIGNLQFGSSSGNPYKCRELMRKLLYNETICLTGSCSINGVYQPTLPKSMTFVAFSAFAYAVNNINLPQNVNLYQFYYNFTRNICNKTYDELKEIYPDLQDTYLQSTCRLNTYIYTLLAEGYSFDINNTNIIFTNKHNDVDITWTQGSILRDSNWLPYDIIYNVENNDNTNDDYKEYVAVIITLSIILTIIIIAIILFFVDKHYNFVDKYYNEVNEQQKNGVKHDEEEEDTMSDISDDKENNEIALKIKDNKMQINIGNDRIQML